ncbi:MAG: DUF1294 domain-containing protein [Lachnoclostridium sp.]|jgi:uncharacterized membrane protein YsdA (DUF1294 family)
MAVLNAIYLYFILMNIAGFTVMGIDKNRAIKKRWRIRESYLFFIAILGGSAGAVLGMYFFRHKTKHMRFVYGMPFILILQALAFFYFLK